MLLVRAFDLYFVRFALLLLAIVIGAPATAQTAVPAQHAFLTLGSTPGELSTSVYCFYLQTAPGQHWDIQLTGNFDTYLTIGRGTQCGNIRADLRNDDSDGTLNSRLRFTASGGAYLVRVSAYLGGRGQFQLHLSPGVPGGPRLQPGAVIAGAPAAQSQQLATATQAGGTDADKPGESAPAAGAASSHRQAFLGVQTQPLTADMAEALGLSVAGGAMVMAVVPGSPAALGGLRRGDIITAIGGEPTLTPQSLTDWVAQQAPGTRAILEVSRDGATGRVLVGLAAPQADEEPQALRAIVRSSFTQGAQASSSSVQVAGLSLASVVPSQVSYGGDTDMVGTVIEAIDTISPAAQTGLARGDVIVRVNNAPATSPAELVARLRAAAVLGRRFALLSVLRGEAIVSIALPIQDSAAQLLAMSAPPVSATPRPPAFQAADASSSSGTMAPLPAASLSGSAPGGRRFALVIGNSFYGPSIGSLPNPGGDADLIASALREVGFDVELVKNADQRTMQRAILRLGERISAGGAGSTGLFFYAGHGMQSRGTNYLIPVDADIGSEAELEFEGVAADVVLRQMEDARAATNIIILDACRNMPLTRGFRSGTRGLARMDAPRGSFIAYSTAPGDVAVDGTGTNSPFALALAQRIVQPREQIEATFREVRRAVLTATNGAQTPWDSSSLVESFAFRP